MSVLIGCVKWFNTKAGYGFITVMEGDHKDENIFAYFNDIHVEKEQYKYLVQGEYVEFELVKVNNKENHQYQASHITGVFRGKLMCETRNMKLAEREKIMDERKVLDERPVKPVRTERPVRTVKPVRTDRPLKQVEKKTQEWTVVNNHH